MRQKKGHREQFDAFVASLVAGTPPMSFAEIHNVTDATLIAPLPGVGARDYAPISHADYIAMHWKAFGELHNTAE